MTDKLLSRFTDIIANDGNGDFSEMSKCSYGSWICRDELKAKLEKALADAPPDGTSDALRDVLSWLGDD